MISKLVPTGIVTTTKENIQILTTHLQNKNKVVDNANLQKTDEKVYEAAYGALGALAMLFGAILGSYILLNFFTIKLCLLTGTAVGAYVLGHDVFTMARNKGKEKIKESEEFTKFLKVPAHLIDKVTDGTFLPKFWKELLSQKEIIIPPAGSSSNPETIVFS